MRAFCVLSFRLRRRQRWRRGAIWGDVRHSWLRYGWPIRCIRSADSLQRRMCFRDFLHQASGSLYHSVHARRAASINGELRKRSSRAEKLSSKFTVRMKCNQRRFNRWIATVFEAVHFEISLHAGGCIDCDANAGG